MDDGLPTPELDDRPEFPSSLLWVVEDFHRLESERSVGMGLGPIPVTRMQTYLRNMQTPRELWQECILYWLMLDSETRRHEAAKVQKEMPSAPKGGRRVEKSAYPEG